ncbi:MAG: hypothetical protein ACO1PI_04120 [Bacteroidota bacterium]
MKLAEIFKHLKNKILLWGGLLFFFFSCKSTCPTVTSVYKGTDKYAGYEFTLNAEDSSFLFKMRTPARTIYSSGKWYCTDNNLILMSVSPESFFKDTLLNLKRKYLDYIEFEGKWIDFNNKYITIRSDSLIHFERKKIRLIKQ